MRKRDNDVFDRMTSIANVNWAGHRASKDKKYREDVVAYRNDADRYNIELAGALISDTYEVLRSDYTVFDLKTPSGKWRRLEKLDFYPHRMAQHAMLNVMEPIWVRSLTLDVYNCLPGRGINAKDKNLDFVHKFKRAMCDFAYSLFGLQMDIKSFYASVDNRRHAKTYRNDIKDKRMLRFLDMYTNSTDGLAIGSPDSQIRSHLELRKMDRFIKEELKVRYYFRYADDIVILSNSKAELHQWQWRIMNYLWYNHKLRIGSRAIRPTTEGIDVCGYVFYPGYTKLRKRIKKNIIKRRHKPKSMASYNGIMMNCNSKNFIEKVVYGDNKHMNSIANLGIKIERRFDGERIKIERLVDETIRVLDYDVRESQKRKDTYWLMMQIEHQGEKRFVKGGYSFLCEFLVKLDEQLVGDTSEMSDKQIIEARKKFLPLNNVVIKEDRGYYFEGTLDR